MSVRGCVLQPEFVAMAKSDSAKKTSQVKAARDGSTRQLAAVAQRMKDTNTASPEIARTKLKELGILSGNGKLSKNYK